MCRPRPARSPTPLEPLERASVFVKVNKDGKLAIYYWSADAIAAGSASPVRGVSDAS